MEESRNISLVDTCIFCLRQHPEIDIAVLPQDLRDHLQARRIDSRYRVNPSYNSEVYKQLNDTIVNLIKMIHTSGSTSEKIHWFLEMFKFLCQDPRLLQYYPHFKTVVRLKLYELYDDDRMKGHRDDLQQFYYRLFGSKMIEVPK
jgi:hypothetical protein